MNNTRVEYTPNHDRRYIMPVGFPTPQNIETQLSNVMLGLAIQVNWIQL